MTAGLVVVFLGLWLFDADQQFVFHSLLAFPILFATLGWLQALTGNSVPEIANAGLGSDGIRGCLRFMLLGVLAAGFILATISTAVALGLTV